MTDALSSGAALQDGKRANHRSRVFLAVKLYFAGQERDAKVLDVSSTGALISLAEGLAIDSEVTIARGAMTIEGRVVWSAAGKSGIVFHSPILERELIGQSHAAGTSKPTTTTLVTPARRVSKTEERLLLRTWSGITGLSVN